MNKKLISNVICLLTSGVCFFFVVTGINSAILDFATHNEMSKTISEYEKYNESYSGLNNYLGDDYGYGYDSDYDDDYSSSDNDSLKKQKDEAGKYMLGGFASLLLAILSTAGIVLAIFQLLGKKIFSAFGFIAASITTATGLAYLIWAIIAVSDKNTETFTALYVGEHSPLSVSIIIFSILYFLILAAQFLAIFFSKGGDNTQTYAPVAPVAPVAAPVVEQPVAEQPVAEQPVAEQPVAPAAPEAPAAPAADQSVDPGTPNLG